MIAQKLYSIKDIAQILEKSESWVYGTFHRENINPAEVRISPKGAKKFLFSANQIGEFEKFVFRKKAKRKKSIKPTYASNEVNESENKIDKLNKEIIQLRTQLKLNQEQLTLKMILLDVLNESDFKLSSQDIENMVGQIMQWHYKCQESQK